MTNSHDSVKHAMEAREYSLLLLFLFFFSECVLRALVVSMDGISGDDGAGVEWLESARINEGKMNSRAQRSPHSQTHCTHLSLSLSRLSSLSHTRFFFWTEVETSNGERDSEITDDVCSLLYSQNQVDLSS